MVGCEQLSFSVICSACQSNAYQLVLLALQAAETALPLYGTEWLNIAYVVRFY